MAHGWVNQMNICLSISLCTSFTKYTIWQKFIIALTLYGLFITICKLFKYLLKTLLYIQIIILTPLMKRLKKKKDLHTPWEIKNFCRHLCYLVTKENWKDIAFTSVELHFIQRCIHKKKKKTSWSQNYAWKSKSPLKYSIQHLQTMLEADSQYAQHSQFFLSVQTDGSFFGWVPDEVVGLHLRPSCIYIFLKVLIFKH